MERTMTVDEMALRLILAGDEAGLTRLAARVDKMIGKSCPECKDTRIMDNGATRRSDLTFCCEGCGHQWDAEAC